MSKRIDSSVYDAALNDIKNNVTQIIVCSAEPTTYAEATSTYKIASKTGLTSGSFTGPAAGDVTGRKLTVNAITTDNATATATGTHVALCTGSVLKAVTTMTSQSITTGNPVNIPAYKITLPDPT